MQGNQFDFTSLGSRRILVVEDVELNQYLARHILESWGFEVVIANNGQDALQLFNQAFFDCILMDVQMPEMDGIEATANIRRLADPIKAAVPIIAFTANTHLGDTKKYLAAGMNDYLAKPFDEVKLFSALCRNLSDKPMEESMKNEKNNQVKKNHPDPATGNSLYDLSMVISVSGGDSAFIKKMIDLFITTVPPNVQELVKGVESSNWEQVRKMAHKLKSTLDSMGIASLHQDIRSVETFARLQKSLDEIPPLVQRIQTVIDQCIVQLAAEKS